MLRLSARRADLPSRIRFYSTELPQKPSLKLVAELRKLTEVSITKAREALSATNNDVQAALDWLQKDLVTSGAKKAAKVEGRTAGEGLISVCVLSNRAGNNKRSMGGVRAAMVELNCETDFVGRNDLFGKLAADIAHTAAFMSEPVVSLEGNPRLLTSCSLDMLNDAPLLSQHASPLSPSTSTIASAIRDTIAKVGEKVALRRALTVVQSAPPHPDLGLRLASYLHGSVNLPSQGRIGTLALLALKSPQLSTLLASESFGEALGRLERSVARQIVGFDTRLIRSSLGLKDETALYEQPFMMLAGGSTNDNVRTVLNTWAREQGMVKEGTEDGGGIEVLEFAKWAVGEALDDGTA